jgi:glucose/mannose transport system substrate-binding protein
MEGMKIRNGAALGVFVALFGCGGGSGSSTPSGTVEIYSWWTGFQAFPLNALLADYTRQYPNVTVDNATGMNAATAMTQLAMRLANGDPPETFQVTAGYPTINTYVVTNGMNASQSKLEALDALSQEQDWATNMNPAVLASVSYGGHPYAVPVDMERTNALFYNKSIFAKYDLQPPMTMADFENVAQVLTMNGVTPVAVGTSGGAWVLDMIFKGLLITEGSAAYHNAFFGGQNAYFSGQTATPDATFIAAVNDYGTIMKNANLTTMPQLTWNQAVDLVASGQAGMTIMGDWAIGEFVAQNAKPAVDFDEVATPGSGSVFMFTSDVFVLPLGAPNRAAAIALLAEWGSQRGQDIFNPLKGSISARLDTNASLYNSVSQEEIMALKTLTGVPDMYLIVPSEFQTALDNALEKFSMDNDVQNVLLAVKNNYALLQAAP